MADREIKKQKFQTIETDTEELNKKIRAHRLRILKYVCIIMAILALIAAGLMLMLRLRQYTGYEVVESTERADTLAARYKDFNSGYIKYSNDGASYIDNSGNMIWNQTYEMQDPVVDTCEKYVSFAEKGGTQIYILNNEKLQGRIETTMAISNVQVASQGTVAVLMEKDGTSYIELFDKSGSELAGGQIHIENSGYPLDIALSNDAIKLAVSMVDVTGGELKSAVVFYNFGSVGQNEIDHMVGSYTYSDLVIPEIEFVTNNRLLAFGDNKVLIFEGTQKPSVSEEIELEKEIKSVFFNEKYFGLVNNNDDEENSRHLEIYDTSGSHVLSKDFVMDYSSIEFLSEKEICIRSDTECLIYNTYGVEHFKYTFDVNLVQILAGSTSRDYTFILEDTTEKVRLK